jgi:O-methyltransferase involved in polyketide biosynthesis
MSRAKGDLSVTALYTSATWSWGRLANAELFDHVDARRVFRVVNAVLGISRPFIGLRSPLPLTLLHRHTLIDALLRASDTRHVLELAAGLSRRGVTFSADPAIDYIEIDRPNVVAIKRSLLERSESGRAALARANFHIETGDVMTASLDAICPPNGEPLFVIAEGLFVYLEAEHQRNLVRAIAERLADAGGTFAFDLVPPSELPAPGAVGRALDWTMKRWTGGRGFVRDDRTRAEVKADLLACGFDRVDIIEPQDVARAWGLPHPDVVTQQLVFVAQVDPELSRGKS